MCLKQGGGPPGIFQDAAILFNAKRSRGFAIQRGASSQGKEAESATKEWISWLAVTGKVWVHIYLEVEGNHYKIMLMCSVT